MLRVLIFLFLFSSYIFSMNLNIKNQKDIYNNFEIEFYNDKTSSLTIDSISNKDFLNKTQSNFSLGYKEGSIWFKFSVKNNSDDNKFILNLNENFYEIANLYYFDKKWITKSLSMTDNISDRKVKSHNLAFDITIPKNSSKEYFLELKGKYAYFGNIEINKKPYYYFRSFAGIDTFFIFLFGLLFMIMFFTLFLYLSTKEKIYIYYLSFVFFNAVYYIKINGFLVYVDLQRYIYDLQLSAAFMLGFLTLFSKEYLETKKYLPKIDKVLTFISIIFFILGILVLFSYHPWNKFINNFAGLLNIFLIIVSIIVYFKGKNKTTKYYTFVMLLYFTFVVMFSFMVNGTLEYTNTTRYGFVFASVIEVTLFSFILANRYNVMKRNTQMYLEEKVEDRTAKLNILINQKELLLKEVHHRVKNNFHMLIGMLHLEDVKKEDKDKDLQALANRVKSMSIIHEYLYKSKDISDIAIEEYLEKIIINIKKSYPKIDIYYHIDEVKISFDDALSMGIIINEILTNSIKHNKEVENLIIDMKLFKNKNRIYLTIQDTGNGFEIKKKSLGLKLVDQLCNKLLNAEYNFTFKNGTIFKLNFDLRAEDGK